MTFLKPGKLYTINREWLSRGFSDVRYFHIKYKLSIQDPPPEPPRVLPGTEKIIANRDLPNSVFMFVHSRKHFHDSGWKTMVHLFLFDGNIVCFGQYGAINVSPEIYLSLFQLKDGKEK